MTKVNSLTIDKSCFSGNTFINSVDCGKAKWADDSMSSAFKNCTSLTSVSQISNTITNLDYTFDSCSKLTGNIRLDSSNISSATDCFSSTSLKKNVFIPYNTTTYTTLTALGYDESGSKDGVYLKDKDATYIHYYDYTRDAESSDYELNATKVGSPTIDENWVASGFDTSNYLKFNTSTTSSSPSSFEIVFKVTTPNTFTSNGRVIQPTDGKADSTTAPHIQINSENAVLFFYNGTSYMNFDAMDSPLTNTTYWFKWIYDGSNIKSYYSTNGKDYTLNSKSAPAWTPIFNSTEYDVGCRSFDKASVCVWDGSVDLSECYIKINGEEVWRGVKISDSSKLNAYVIDESPTTESVVYSEPKVIYNELNATKVGDPDIDKNFIMTGGSGKYIAVPQYINFGNYSSWEIGTIYTYNGGGYYPCIFGYTGGTDYKSPCLVFENGYLKMYLSSSGNSWDLIAQTIVPTENKTYYIKYGFTGSEYYVDIKYNENDEYERKLSISSTTKCYCSVPLMFMNLSLNSNYYSNGTMNLLKTYIICDSEEVWRGVNTYKITSTTSNSITLSNNKLYKRNEAKDEYIGQYTLTINPTPSDATVTLTAEGYTQFDNSITVDEGTTVSYEVSKEKYSTKSGAITMYSDKTQEVVLDAYAEYQAVALNDTVATYNIGDSIYVNDGMALNNYEYTACPCESTYKGDFTIVTTISAKNVVDGNTVFAFYAPQKDTVTLTINEDNANVNYLSGEAETINVIASEDNATITTSTTLTKSTNTFNAMDYINYNLTVNPTLSDNEITLVIGGQKVEYSSLPVLVKKGTYAYYRINKDGYNEVYNVFHINDLTGQTITLTAKE